MKQLKWIVAILTTVGIMTGCSGNSGPQNLDGHWESDNGDLGMVAEIRDDWIVLDLKLEESTGLYWKGTFESVVEDKTTITSEADTEALEFALFGSQSETKEFVFEDGLIKFEFTMLGTTTNIELEQVNNEG